MATRLRTASTDEVRISTVGSAPPAFHKAVVASPNSSTCNRTSDCRASSVASIFSSPVRRWLTGSHTRQPERRMVSVSSAWRFCNCDTTISATSSSPLISRCSR
ncbi:hypothetical protein Y695_04806 [Hydrogenophaga sp. T4]|nr:hypothetical protein Y695_04806 [Hydrogenophaga sp. T4]